MSYSTLAKSTTELVVSMSTGTVVTSVIKNALPNTTKVLPRIGQVVGVAVLTSMVGDFAAKYVTRQIEEVMDGIKNTDTTETPDEN